MTVEYVFSFIKLNDDEHGKSGTLSSALKKIKAVSCGKSKLVSNGVYMRVNPEVALSVLSDIR